MAKVIILTSNIDHYRNSSSQYAAECKVNKKFHILTEHIGCVEEWNATHSVVHVGTNSFHVHENVNEIFQRIWN